MIIRPVDQRAVVSPAAANPHRSVSANLHYYCGEGNGWQHASSSANRRCRHITSARSTWKIAQIHGLGASRAAGAAARGGHPPGQGGAHCAGPGPGWPRRRPCGPAAAPGRPPPAPAASRRRPRPGPMSHPGNSAAHPPRTARGRRRLTPPWRPARIRRWAAAGWGAGRGSGGWAAQRVGGARGCGVRSLAPQRLGFRWVTNQRPAGTGAVAPRLLGGAQVVRPPVLCFRCVAGKVGCVVSFFPSLCPRRDRRGGALSTCTVQRAHIGLDTLRPGTDPLWGGIGGDTAAILLGLKLYTSFPFLHRYITLIAGSHHLISQAGWNRCNLSIYLSIFSISLAVLLSCGGRRVQVLRRWQQPELRVTRVVPFIPSQLEQMCDSCLLLHARSQAQKIEKTH